MKSQGKKIQKYRTIPTPMWSIPLVLLKDYAQEKIKMDTGKGNREDIVSISIISLHIITNLIRHSQ